MPRASRRVSDLCMAEPGPTKPLDLESHRAFEATAKCMRRDMDKAEAPQRLAAFIAARDIYWKKSPPSHPHGRSMHRLRGGAHTKPNQGNSGATYMLSPDECWVMESFGSPADMCFLTDRYIFNLWTYEQLLESDMKPWASLSPPGQHQLYDQWAGCDATAADATSPKLAETSPNLHHNVGCHDDSDDEDPRPDYETGCRQVRFLEVDLTACRKLSRKAQVICASRFANTFDKSGMHWIYVLPSSPLEATVERLCLQSRVPHPIASKLWECACSWPAECVSPVAAAACGKHKTVVQMKADPNWPYNVLRARQHACVPQCSAWTTEDIVAIVPSEALETFVFRIDVTKSTPDFWKLAAATKEALVTEVYMLKDFQVEEEGFIVKNYEGHNTLVRADTVSP
mmetsp:Transcript_38381/g.110941  ORF Transcript_38381/g.110941 Transcript_38381/m.110941 type:complete len:399 (-) Transcript_38381:88-1284(-)